MQEIYSLNLYFNDLSLINTSKQYPDLLSYTAIRKDWVQKYKPAERLFYSKTKILQFIIDETQLKVGSEYIWLYKSKRY